MKLDRPFRGIKHDTDDYRTVCDRCPRTGKQRHAKDLKRAGKGPMSVYQCPHCNGGWHVATARRLVESPRR